MHPRFWVILLECIPESILYKNYMQVRHPKVPDSTVQSTGQRGIESQVRVASHLLICDGRLVRPFPERLQFQGPEHLTD